MTITYLEKSILLPQLDRQEVQRVASSRRARIQSTEFTYGRDFHSFGRAYFDGGQAAAAYRSYEYDGRFLAGVESIARLCSLPRDAAILELGCAKGYILAEFDRAGYEDLTGVDISEYAVDSAYHAVAEKLVRSDALTFLSACERKYHLIIIKEMLPHLSRTDVDKVLCFLPDRLYEEGHIYLEIQCAANGDAANLIRKFDPTHQVLWDKAQWKETLESSASADCKLLVYLKDLV